MFSEGFCFKLRKLRKFGGRVFNTSIKLSASLKLLCENMQELHFLEKTIKNLISSEEAQIDLADMVVNQFSFIATNR